MKKTRVIFNASSYDYLMRANGCSVGFNMPEALKGESTHSLPPYRKRMPYLVDEFPACPTNWMRSEGKTKSYFVPVNEGDGMWLDFNNNEFHTHHLAIVVSIQGINPITGMPCNDAQLEQYIEECPKHKIKFGPDRYCKKCYFKWPKQNYICTTGTPNGSLWLDGFKAADGVVRQYILTEEKMRGVASNIIGKDRVYAIGLSFFLAKDKKPVEAPSRGLAGNWTTSNNSYVGAPYGTPTGGYWNFFGNIKGSTNDPYVGSETHVFCSSVGKNACLDMLSVDDPNFDSQKTLKAKSLFRCATASNVIQTKKLEIGAGAKIDQLIYDDPKNQTIGMMTQRQLFV